MTTNQQHAGMDSASAAPIRLLPGHIGSIRGAALVITLSLLVLVTALVVTLFLTATNERVESSAAGTQEDAHRLRNGVVNLVKSTITQATSGYEANGDGSPNLSNPTAWISQPGLISTWKHDGTPDRSFRLYSSGTIAVTGSLDLAAEASTLSTWKSGTTSYNALWCDLNAPALSSSKERVYPIITPPADTNTGSTATDATCGVPTDDPVGAAMGQAQLGIQGFSIKSPPGYLASGSASVTNNPAPMPVKWLYLLQDGSFLTPDPSSDGSTVKISGSASKLNPIVGRVAYWTDDDTCKVNVNTASEYFYWEAPSTYSTPDANRAMYQPASGEYQRYPGHPSTTSLSAVFEKLGPASATESDFDRKTRYEKAFNLAPRIAGTVDGKPYTGGNAGGSQAGTAVGWFDPATKLVPDQDRLYATGEELLYDPMRAEQLVKQQLLNKPGDLQTRLGFLTARSTSPDVNWMNQPRISLWPLNPNETSKWSASDKLLAFCGTLSGTGTPSIYYFQRTNGFDPSADFNIPRIQPVPLLPAAGL